MTKHRGKKALIVAWVALCALGSVSASAANDLRLNVAVGSDVVTPGDTITVTLDVANLVGSINGVQALFSYDSTLMTLIDIVPTNLGLAAPDNGWAEITEVDNNGDVSWAATVNGGSILINHTIATMTFTALAEGVTSLLFPPGIEPFVSKFSLASTNGTLLANTFGSAAILITCDDGVFCNGVEVFAGGLCLLGTFPCDDGVGCTVDTCQELTQFCTNTPTDTLCDNGLFCDGAETCDAILDCQLGTDPCNDGVGCTNDSCDDLIDTCTNAPNDLNCDDGLFCNGAETCDLVNDCQAGIFPCDDGVGCTDETCSEVSDTCSSTPNDANCDDALFCNGAETCDALADCQPGSFPCDDAVGCTVDTCDDLLDICINTPDDVVCDDGVFCNGSETCDALADCQAGFFPCDDAVGCTDDSCDEFADLCIQTPNDLNCDDTLFCNGSETCDAVNDCQAGVFPCDDGVGCTINVCDEPNDTCSNPVNNAICDDGLFCTGIESCDAVLDCVATGDPCLPGQFCNDTTGTCDQCQVAADCDDLVLCTDDDCVAGSCVNTPNDLNCDDGLFCNGSETCDAVSDCLPGVFPCDDAVACTIDTCDDFADLCINTADDTFCDNGFFCDGTETCDVALDCQVGFDPCAPLLCDDVNDTCFAPIHVANLEVFYAGRFGNQPDTSRAFLASGSIATQTNITNYTRGITGIRVEFDNLVTFATTPAAAFLFDWTTGTGSTFSPMTDVALNVSVTAVDVGGVTIVTILLADDHVRRRWLQVSIDATQVTTAGVQLDGELFGSPMVFPSGDGTPGGDAIFFLGNLGDVDGDRRTRLDDVGLIREQVNAFVAVPITSILDIDKDGRIRLDDVGAVRADVNAFFALPLISP